MEERRLTIDEAIERLQDQELRLTKHRQTILQVIWLSDRALTAPQIHKMCAEVMTYQAVQHTVKIFFAAGVIETTTREFSQHLHYRPATIGTGSNVLNSFLGKKDPETIYFIYAATIGTSGKIHRSKYYKSLAEAEWALGNIRGEHIGAIYRGEINDRKLLVIADEGPIEYTIGSLELG